MRVDSLRLSPSKVNQLETPHVRVRIMDHFDLWVNGHALRCQTIYALLIQTLAKQNTFSEAKDWYKPITDSLYKALGVRPTRELQQRYARCVEENNPWEQDLGMVRESMRDTNEKREAFYAALNSLKPFTNWRFAVRPVTAAVCTWQC